MIGEVRSDLNGPLHRWSRRYLRRFGNRGTVRSDLRAGLVLGVESVPDGLAAGLLAGLNPLQGLYGYLMGTLGGALVTGSVFMTVQSTGAMAVIISDVNASTPGGLTAGGLATLGLLVGMVMLALGVAGLGSLVRFIPGAVLVGFINAVAVNIVLGQLGSATGFVSDSTNRITRSLDTALNVAQWSVPAVVVTVTTLALVLVLERTRLGPLSLVAAVMGASAVAWLLGALFDGVRVETVADFTTVPNALPTMVAPDLSHVLSLIVPALSLALVALVQGAAISGSIPNPGGGYADPSADFRGQGVANVASGLFQGLPVGGSMSSTALVRAAGARSALANLIAAAVMAIVILLFAGVIGYVAMPALAGLLIIVGVRTFRLDQVIMVSRTGPVQATVLGVTFVLTLLIPLQFAVLTGVGLAVILFVVRQSNRIVIRRWVFEGSAGLPTEVEAPATLDPDQIVVLVPYGSLFFAAAPVLEKQLPTVGGDCANTAVIIRLRGKDEIGSTFLKTIETYRDRVAASGGVVMLAGVSEHVRHQLRATGAVERFGPDRIFGEHPQIGASVREALDAVDRWRAAGHSAE